MTKTTRERIDMFIESVLDAGQPPPSFGEIASAVGVSRQRVHQLASGHPLLRDAQVRRAEAAQFDRMVSEVCPLCGEKKYNEAETCASCARKRRFDARPHCEDCGKVLMRAFKRCRSCHLMRLKAQSDSLVTLQCGWCGKLFQRTRRAQGRRASNKRTPGIGERPPVDLCSLECTAAHGRAQRSVA